MSKTTPRPLLQTESSHAPNNYPLTFASKDHPRVFARMDQRESLLHKIENVDWAQKIYSQLKAEVDPWVEKHVVDPEWMVSRLQMHWDDGQHYTHFYTNSTEPHPNTIPRREGNAPYPTVRVAYHRVGQPLNPTPLHWEMLQPYGCGDLPILTNNRWKLIPFEETFLGAEHVNQTILELAYRAAIVYYFTEENKYAKFSADIIWTFIRGASYQLQLNPHEETNSMGYLSYETLGDTRRFATLPLTYDFIHSYLMNEYFTRDEFITGTPGKKWAPPQPGGKKWALERIQVMFQKYLDNKLTRGGGLDGNWNTNEQQSSLLYAFALEDNAFYSNGKGRAYYLQHMLLGPVTKTMGPYFKVIEANIHPQTGLWCEPPGGYGQGSIAQLVTFGYWYFQNGIDVLKGESILKKAAGSFFQMAFPNGLSTGWGDSGYSPYHQSSAEYLIAYARATGDSETEKSMSELLNNSGERKLNSNYYGELFFFVPQLQKSETPISYSRTSYSPNHSIIFQRNCQPDPVNSLCYSVYGFGKGIQHRHRNGLAMELYGRGHVLGIDSGRGPNYWDRRHLDYNFHVSAHNAVVPNGLFSADGESLELVIEACEPDIQAGKSPEIHLSENIQFSDTSGVFVTRAGEALQRRVMAIIRTGPDSGFYLDIFRSKMRSGRDTHHDYIYHNLGRELKLLNTLNQPLTTHDIKLDPLSGPGYEYFEVKEAVETAQDFYGIFDVGILGMEMKLAMLGNEGRTVFSLTATSDCRDLCNLPQPQVDRLPVALIRQTGEACKCPFIAIFEPSGNGTNSHISLVRRLKGTDLVGDFVGLAVESHQGRVDLILNATQYKVQHQAEGVTFSGLFAVITVLDSAPPTLYLGTGLHLDYLGYGIESADDRPVKATLYKNNGQWHYSANREVLITLPHQPSQFMPPAQDRAIAQHG